MKKAVYDFTGQGVVVTGGATSIGRAMAEQFIEAGAKVYICSRTGKSLDKALAEVPGLTGSIADVGDSDAVDAMARDALDALGHVDVLVNNVAIDGATGPVEDLDIETWRNGVEVNLNSMFYIARHFVPGMKERGHGAIINISTAGARTTPPYMSNYNATKVGVEGLTMTLARELGEFGIRCNVIRPGGVDNERVREYFGLTAEREGRTVEEVEQEALQFISMRTLVSTSDIADATLFLASPSAKHITGQILGVDGGVEWDQ